MSEAAADVIVPTCDNGGPCGVYNYLEFLGTSAAGVRVTAAIDICVDHESDIASVELGIGSRPGFANLAPFLSVAPPQTDIPLTFTAPPTAGFVYYLVARCTNRAGLSSVFSRAAFRTDGTPPSCYAHLAKAGARPWFGVQSENSSLQVDLRDAVEDLESGIRSVTYRLQEGSEAASTTALDDLSHSGSPPRGHITLGLRLTHKQRYRVVASALNGLGLESSCITNWLLIDRTGPTWGSVLMLRQASDTYLPTPPEAAFQPHTDVVYITLRGFEDAESGLECFFVSVFGMDGWPLLLDARYQQATLLPLRVALVHKQDRALPWHVYRPCPPLAHLPPVPSLGTFTAQVHERYTQIRTLSRSRMLTYLVGS